MPRKKSNTGGKRFAGRVKRSKRKRRLSARSFQLITKLHAVIKRNVAKWDKKYPGVILGYHVAKKVKRGKAQRRYAVVFHVDRKIDDHRLSPSQRLPRHVTLRMPKRGVIKVPTDVSPPASLDF